MKNKNVKMEKEKLGEKKYLKAGVDSFENVIQFILNMMRGCGLMNECIALWVVGLYGSYLQDEFFLTNIIAQVTQTFIETTLGQGVEVSREGFINLDKQLLKFRYVEDQERLIEEVIKRLETYCNTQVLQDVEAQKFKQVILELNSKLQGVKELVKVVKEKTTK